MDKVEFNHGRDALAFFNDPANQPWALKDPRLCVTLKFWLPYWTKPPSILFVYRHPVERALSLSRLNEYGGARGMYMWIAHNRLAIQNSQGLCRVVTSDADLIQDGPGTLYMVYNKLRDCGVDVPHMATTESINSFIDPNCGITPRSMQKIATPRPQRCGGATPRVCKKMSGRKGHTRTPFGFIAP